MKHKLKTLQNNFSLAILQENFHTLDYKNSPDFSGLDLIKVYQNAYQDKFKNALKSSYSAVCRLVGEDFFAFLSHRYLQENPPKKGCLQHYGEYFSQFLVTIKECEGLPYLSDLAKLEQYYEQCYHNKNSVYNFSQMSYIDQVETYDIIKGMNVSYLLYSKYPILDIWKIDKNSPTLNLNQGGDYVLLFKYQDKITIMRLTQFNFNLLTKLQNVHTN